MPISNIKENNLIEDSEIDFVIKKVSRIESILSKKLLGYN